MKSDSKEWSPIPYESPERRAFSDAIFELRKRAGYEECLDLEIAVWRYVDSLIEEGKKKAREAFYAAREMDTEHKDLYKYQGYPDLLK